MSEPRFGTRALLGLALFASTHLGMLIMSAYLASDPAVTAEQNEARLGLALLGDNARYAPSPLIYMSIVLLCPVFVTLVTYGVFSGVRSVRVRG